MASNKRQRYELPADMTVGFIGAGRMAQAMCKGFITAGMIKPDKITASDVDTQMLSNIEKLGIKTTKCNKEVVRNSDLVCIAVKPDIVKPVLVEISPIVTRRNLFMSIAAGIPLKTLHEILPSNTRVIRVMPNTPALVQSGAAFFSCGPNTQDGDCEIILALMSSIGICEQGKESLMDAVTGLSGSGPAYAFCAIDALADGGVKMGLPRDLAIKLAAQTLMGAAKMVLETGQHPSILKDQVCSPGGTTIDAVHMLEKGGFRGALIDAVEVATNKSRLLGNK